MKFNEYVGSLLEAESTPDSLQEWTIDDLWNALKRYSELQFAGGQIFKKFDDDYRLVIKPKNGKKHIFEMITTKNGDVVDFIQHEWNMINLDSMGEKISNFISNLEHAITIASACIKEKIKFDKFVSTRLPIN